MKEPKWRLEPCSHGGAILIRGDGVHGAHMQTHLQIAPIEDAQLIVQAPAMRDFIMALASINGDLPFTAEIKSQARAILKEIRG